jgi:SAM-dependent methyltransferase
MIDFDYFFDKSSGGHGKSFHELKQEWKKIGASWQTGIDAWNKNSISYLRLGSILQLKEYLDYQDLNLLDLGCDNGLYSYIIGDKFKKVLGIDGDELSIKRASITKNFFEKDGYNLNNIEFNTTTFEEYCINPKYQVDESTFIDTIWNSEKHDLIINSNLENDNINAILACEILSLFDDNLMSIFNKVLENVELIMIQSKFKEKNQWEWDKSEYAQSSVTQIKKWNSYENYAMDDIVKYLKQQGFSKIEIVSPDSNCSLVIGER